jgi:arylsulfatase A-like enzyme
MILIVVLDGLRPDLVTPEQMPWLSRTAAGGVFCQHSHAVFPTATRINSAALATGCRPGRHGIVGNELYARAVDPLKAISCADHRALLAMAAAEGGRLVSVPTLAERLREAGRSMVAVGSGSPGTTFLLDPTQAGAVVNWAAAWPEATQDEVVHRWGAMLDESSDSLERTRFVERALTEYLLPTFRPDVAVFWVTEPDHAQHHAGLGVPESVEMLGTVDAWLEGLVERLEAEYPGALDLIVTSDHGFSTVTNHVSLREEREMIEAALPISLEPGDLVFAGNGLYLNGQAREYLPEIREALGARPWVGGLFVHDDLVECCPGALPQSAVGGGAHRRSPEILYSGAWSAGANAQGVPGLVENPSGSVATHGMASPFDVRNTLIARGPSFKAGAVSPAPCGIVDIAPTVLHLLGVPAEGLDGRLLEEILRDGPAPAEVPIVRTHLRGRLGAGRDAIVEYSESRGHRYMDRVSTQGEAE